MTNLPSESWYGSEPSTQETQLRYTNQEPGQHIKRRLQLQRLLQTQAHKSITRETKRGITWFRGALIILLAGVVLDNSFFLTLAISLLTFTVVAYGWDYLSLMGLTYHRHYEVVGTPIGALKQPRVFVGESLKLTLQVSNLKPMPLLSVEVEDNLPAALPVVDLKTTYNRTTNRINLRSFWVLGAMQTLSRQYTIQCDKRGYHIFGPAQITTGDGFGLFSRTMVLSNIQAAIVYPKLYTASDLCLTANDPLGELTSKLILFEDPLRYAGIRDWRPEDEQRRIHWTATVRHQKLLSRIYEPSEEPHILIFLNCATLERYWEGIIPELNERVISVAASIAAFCIEKRLPVGLIANAYWPGSDQDLRLLPGRSPDQLTHILEMLASVDLPNRPIETHLLSEAPHMPWGTTLVMVTAVLYDRLLEAIRQVSNSGRKIVLFSLSPINPDSVLSGVRIFHLPHLIDDIIMPEENS